MNVNDPPKISKPAGKGPVAQETRDRDDSLTLICNVESGQPAPTITWFKDQQIIDQKKIIASGTILRLEKVSDKDEGLYKCLAENIVGTDAFSWSVKVRGTSRIFLL